MPPRNQIPVENDYLLALGRAAYNFAYLEWGIIHLADQYTQGFLELSHTLTAGQISRQFGEIVIRMPDDFEQKTEVEEVATQFGSLVVNRNKLMHGNPFSADGGEQRLTYAGRHGPKDWTIEEINTFSDQTAELSIAVVRLIHS